MLLNPLFLVLNYPVGSYVLAKNKVAEEIGVPCNVTVARIQQADREVGSDIVPGKMIVFGYEGVAVLLALSGSVRSVRPAYCPLKSTVGVSDLVSQVSSVLFISETVMVPSP